MSKLDKKLYFCSKNQKSSLMKDLQKLGILDYKSVMATSNKTSERSSFASYFKVKPGSNTAPRLNTRLVKMPEGLL